MSERISKANVLNLAKGKADTLSQELDDANEQLLQYEKMVRVQIADQVKDLPKSVRELVDKLDPAEQLDWLEKNTPEVQKKTATKTVDAVPIPSRRTPINNIASLIAQKRTAPGNIYGKL